MSIVPAAAVRDPRLTHAEHRLLAVMGIYADTRTGVARPSSALVAHDMGMRGATSWKKVGVLARKLLDLGYLQLVRPGQGKDVPIYRVVMDHPGAPEVDAGVTQQRSPNDGEGDPTQVRRVTQQGSAGSPTMGHQNDPVNDPGERYSPSPLSAGSDAFSDLPDGEGWEPTQQQAQPAAAPVDVTKREPAQAAMPVIPDWMPAEAWNDWVAHRASIRHPLTVVAAKACVRELAKFRAEGHDPADVISRCIAGGYRGLFAEQQRGGPQRSSSSRPVGGVVAEVARRMRERGDI